MSKKVTWYGKEKSLIERRALNETIVKSRSIT